MSGPNTRTGSWAKVSAERPTINTPSVNTAVRKGEEKDENSRAIAATMVTSHRDKKKLTRTTCLSSTTDEARNKPETNMYSAQHAGRSVRMPRAFQNSTTTTTRPNNATPMAA